MKYIRNTFTLILLIGLAAGLYPEVASGANILAPKSETRQAEGDNQDVRDLVEDIFGDDHIMVDVARCESSFRQFDASGDVLVNEESGAIGVFQLLESYHLEPAEDENLNIYTAEGNAEYAKILYEADGLKPWSPSSLCWDDGEVAETNADYEQESSRNRVIVRSRDDDDDEDDSESDKDTSTDQEEDESRSSDSDDADRVILGSDKNSAEPVEEVISKRLIIGVHDAQVVTLQKLLNDIGYKLANDGPGSPGEETNYFGSLTKAALQKFQCDEDIVCKGAEYTTGYGMVDSETRKALNARAAGIPTPSSRVPIRVRSEESASHSDGEDTEDQDGSSTTELQARIQALQTQIANLRNQLN